MIDYQSKINKALKYIDANLKEDLNVKKLADISGFSLFHFHRIFKAITGETPYESLLRLRLEKSVFLLKYQQELKIAEVGYETGFTSAENFSRQFKARFKISPGAYRKSKELQNSRIYQEPSDNDFYFRIEEGRKQEKQCFDVVIEHLVKIPIAYRKAVFGSDGAGLVDSYLNLMDWAKKENIKTTGELTRFGMSIDNPEVTPSSKFRYDFALKIDQEYPYAEGIEFGHIPEGEYATVHVQGDLELVAQAWDFLYKDWLPTNPYLPIHYPAIEEFIQGPEEIGWDKFNLKCRIPIKSQ